MQWWVPRRRGPGRWALRRWGGLGGDDPGRASLPSPSEFLPRALPLNPRDQARLPFPPPEAKSLPYLNELLRGGEAAHTERHEDPAPGIAALGGVVSELLADLAVDLIPRQAGVGGKDGRRTASEGKPHPSQQQVGCLLSHLPETTWEEAVEARWGRLSPGLCGYWRGSGFGDRLSRHEARTFLTPVQSPRPGPHDPEGGAYPAPGHSGPSHW